jgi:hypothetical protein
MGTDACHKRAVLPWLRRIAEATVILVAQTCPNRAGSRHAPPEMGEEAS